MHLRTSLLALFATAATSLAGGFGPPPFDNGAPTAQGTDGAYQATATAPNLTGVISFQISDGQQVAVSGSSSSISSNFDFFTGQSTTTSSSSSSSGLNAGNDWTMFIDGQIVSGNDFVSVTGGSVAGVLEGANATDPFVAASSNGSSLPSPFVTAVSNADSASGSFQAKLSLNSPTLSFSGSGVIEGTPSRTDQILSADQTEVTVLTADVFTSSGGVTTESRTFSQVPGTEIATSTSTITIPGSSLGTVTFNIRGSRVGTVSSGT